MQHQLPLIRMSLLISIIITFCLIIPITVSAVYSKHVEDHYRKHVEDHYRKEEFKIDEIMNFINSNDLLIATANEFIQGIHGNNIEILKHKFELELTKQIYLVQTLNILIDNKKSDVNFNDYVNNLQYIKKQLIKEEQLDINTWSKMMNDMLKKRHDLIIIMLKESNYINPNMLV